MNVLGKWPPFLRFCVCLSLKLVNKKTYATCCSFKSQQTNSFQYSRKKTCKLILIFGRFLHSALVARVPVLGTRMFFQYSRKQMQAYLGFWELSALGLRCMCSRAWHSYVSPRLAPVLCFPALDTRCMCVCYDWSVLITLVTKYWKTRLHGFCYGTFGYLVITGLHQYSEQGHVIASTGCSCPVCSRGDNTTSFR